MECPNPECREKTYGIKTKYCNECGTALIKYLESISCNGEDEGEQCKEKLRKGNKWCPSCGRKVKPNEFLLGHCQKCGEYCPASNKMCAQCALTSETNARAQLDKFTERDQNLTGSTVLCENCGKSQAGHWGFCLHCGKTHRIQPYELLRLLELQGATGGALPTLRTHDSWMDFRNADYGGDDLEQTQYQFESLQFETDSEREYSYGMGIDEVDDDNLITSKEATVIQKVLDNDKVTKTNTTATQVVTDHSQRTKVATIQKFLGLRRPTKTETGTVPIQNDSNQAEAGAIPKLAGQAHTVLNQTIFDPAEEAEFNNVLDQCGYSELMKLIDMNNNAWRNKKINIAITGESGSGKSSLINALLGLKDDDDGAAKTDCVESTTEPTPYSHPENTNLVIWEMPGVGTPNFPQETYLEKARFKEYDFIILVSSSRYTKLDTWLANKIKSDCRDVNLFFVRTKIDVDLEYAQKGRRKLMSDEEIHALFTKIKVYCYTNLTEAKIENPHVFMVNSYNPFQFEFGKLANMFVSEVSVLKKEALLMSIRGFTVDIIAAKCKLCNKRLKAITTQAAVAAVISNREMEERLEVDILRNELIYYKQQLGIDTDSLDIVARRFRLDIKEVYLKLNSQTHVIIRNFEQYYIYNDKVVPSYLYSLPFLGKWLQLRSYQKQCLFVLKQLLKLCIDENNTLQKNIAIWLLIPN